MKLTLFSDPVCPWCWIGKRRIEKALSNLGLESGAVWTLRAYELSARGAGVGPVWEHLQRKYGGDRHDIMRMFERVKAFGAEDGLEFDFERALSAPTYDAHRLLKFARTKGKDRELLERMHKAHFLEAADLSLHPILAALAAEAGLVREEAALVLADGSFATEVDAELAEGRMIGVRGVPFLLINEEYAVRGAQPVAVFEEALNQARGSKNS